MRPAPARGAGLYHSDKTVARRPAAGMLYQETGFPDSFVGMQHPNDYTGVSKPFAEYIPHFSGRNSHLIVRMCWEKSEAEYVPMSFVCDTGAPMGLYLSSIALCLLRSIGRVLEDESGCEYVEIRHVGKASIHPAPPGYAPANILGLRVIMKLGLNVGNGTFVFKYAPVAW